MRAGLARAIAIAGTLVAPSAHASDAGPTPSPPPPAAAVAAAGPEAPTVRASLSAPEVGLGAVFYLFVAVDHRPGVEVSLPVALPLGQELEETARTDRLVKNPAGGLTREFEVALMAFALGERVVPALPVTWVIDGRMQELTTPPLSLTVTGVIGEKETPLRDIAPPVSVIRRDLSLVWIGTAVLGGVLVLLAGWRLLRRRGRAEAQVAAAAEGLRSPHDEALARLAQVEGSGALDADDRKPVYLELSEIVRVYLGRRFGLPAPDLTTAEIRTRLLATPEPGEALERIVDWLERCDLVKFARGSASEDEARQALYEARIFVERTRDSHPGPGQSARLAEAAAS